MLKLAIDGNEANVQNRVGSNVYAYEVIRALYELKEVRFGAEVTVLLSAPPLSDLPPARTGWRYRIIKPKPLWTQLGLPLHLWLNPHQYDVLFTPGHYAPRWSGIPYISSVMDLAYYAFPEQFRRSDLLQLRDWTAYSVKHAAKVVAISKATKNAILQRFGRSESDVVIGYPALPDLARDMNLKEAAAFEARHGISQPYIVYVGTLQPRKNLVRLIHAFEKLLPLLAKNRAKIVLPQLVIAGKVGWLSDEIMATIEQSSLRERIILTGYVTESEKQHLLQHATASVLVGLYEGFGIPPLESLRLGTIPVVSNTTSLPEVVGKAGILVDPLDEDSIAEGLRRAITLSSRDRAHLRKLGREQVKKFTWQQTAQRIWKTLLDVV